MTSPPFVTAEGNWLQVLRPSRAATLRPRLFLDRDGVIVEHVEYLHRVEDVRLLDGAAAAIEAANAAGWFVVVVANQSGIGRGLYDWPAFMAVQQALLDRLAAAGAQIDLVLACPFHPEANPPYRHRDHPWRKPRPGMLLEAARHLPIDLARSWIVGDRAIDIAAGRAAGLVGGIHIGDQPERQAALRMADGRYAVRWGEGPSAAKALLCAAAT